MTIRLYLELHPRINGAKIPILYMPSCRAYGKFKNTFSLPIGLFRYNCSLISNPFFLTYLSYLSPPFPYHCP